MRQIRDSGDIHINDFEPQVAAPVGRNGSWRQDQSSSGTTRGAICEAFSPVDGIAYEDVKSIFRGNYAALNYGGLKTIIELFALERKIPIYPVPVGTLKKWATGKGNSNKKVMMQTCETRLGIKPRDDNEVDALWLLDYIIKNYIGKKNEKE